MNLRVNDLLEQLGDIFAPLDTEPMARALQPSAEPMRRPRWGRACGNWVRPASGVDYVDCHAAEDIIGASYDASRRFRVYLPGVPGGDPNVVVGQVLAYAPCEDGRFAALSGYLDAAIGTVRLWAPTAADPPVGWTECKPGGTTGREASSLPGLAGRFPVGHAAADADFHTVAATGAAQRTHGHGLLRDESFPNWDYTNSIDEGANITTLLSVAEQSHLPPWCVVRFIERYDNSSQES